MFCGVDDESDGPEVVVVSSLGMVEQQLPRLVELASLQVELFEELGVEVYV